MGQRFNNLTVIAEAPNYVSPSGKSSTTQWLCRCDCGCEVLVKSGYLKIGRAKTCGMCGFSDYEDLTGRIFGRLTVIARADDAIALRTNRSMIQWRCRCDCGNEVIVRDSVLRNGHMKSCGCRSRKPRHVFDLTGYRFGKLTVVGLGERRGGYVMWRCKCDCGNEIETRTASLRNGHTQSCGCLHSDAAIGIGLQDITGQRFGRWTVLYENGRLKEPRGRLITLWRCRCDCGEERDLRAGTLKTGSSLSCGCFKYERLSELASHGFGISKAEQVVNTYLQRLGVYYEPQKIYDNLRAKSGYPLSFDFLVYKDARPYILIECQGQQHYQPVEYFGGERQFRIQQENDGLKRKYAAKIGLPLVEIPYTCKSEGSIIQLLAAYFENVE